MRRRGRQTIRIKQAVGKGWVKVELLKLTQGWVQVDDGNGPLWVMWAEVHPDDLKEIRFGVAKQ